MNVILGVSGCIAAYKCAVILRLLQQEGFDVYPVMTRHAQEFITALTLEKLSGHRVISDLFGTDTVLIEHIALARKSDLFLVAPATANVLGKFAQGIADDFLSTLYLSTVAPVVVVPAMNVEMWRHPATEENVRVLKDRGVVIVEPTGGYLACGEVGEGRLAEPEKVLRAVWDTLRPTKSLIGKRVLVSAGPTVEDIDPVRLISNRSSGKMGYALAQEAWQRGAQVVLISGPTYLDSPQGVETVQVRGAADMGEAIFPRFSAVDVVLMVAAVSDLTPVEPSPQKIQKEKTQSSLILKPTLDILKELGKRKRGQFLVGFVAESQNLHQHATQKLQEKNLDLVVANDISLPGQGFGADCNQVLLIDPKGSEEESPVLPKAKLARFIWDKIEARVNVRSTVVG